MQKLPKDMSRREALGVLGAGAAAAALAGPAAAEPTFAKGAVIRTVLKDYAPGELGGAATLFHEHMSQRIGFIDDWVRVSAETRAANAPKNAPAAPPAPPRPAPTGPQPPNGLTDLDLISSEVATAKAEGIGCIVDCSVPDQMERSVPFLRQISQKSGMPIVASAGFYSEPFYPKELASWSEDRVFQELMKQVNGDTIGALGEIGSWDYISKNERKVFRAVARCHVATGLPIISHTGIPGKSALEQLDIFEDGGADLKHVVIGHLGNLVDQNTEIHRAILRRGAFVGFDRQGGNYDDPVAQMAMSLIDQGYADQLLFSADLSHPREFKKFGGGGYGKTLTIFAPKVKKLGASDEVIHKIMVDNPRRLLAHVPKVKRKA